MAAKDLAAQDNKGRVALITGVTGQDSGYLAQYSLGLGYGVHGTNRRSSAFNTARVDRPTEIDLLVGDASSARAKLGWKPKTPFAQLVKEMVAGDLGMAKREAANG